MTGAACNDEPLIGLLKNDKDPTLNKLEQGILKGEVSLYH